ncbi:STAS/SEC14 domain-containing protein [Lutibacter sp.]|uniref:STAS/SEC14 domain-containing protein n=1 Tax=Lutibacter sp. TaxID=1925666 RepID=UPI0025B8D234|nr:STAS/SEC14 domain-containing protein [Lutibacter sp.]MCF6182599.1 STAS/SEC14 domain-containing protein [Lutibacter sp.]
MIQLLKNTTNNVLALEVIESFTEADEKFCQKLFDERRNLGIEQINVLIKLDELKISKISIKAFFEDIIWTFRNYKHLGHIAIVAHSNIIKALVPIDNLFFERASKGRLERYFDVSQLKEAFDFVAKTN